LSAFAPPWWRAAFASFSAFESKRHPIPDGVGRAGDTGDFEPERRDRAAALAAVGVVQDADLVAEHFVGDVAVLKPEPLVDHVEVDGDRCDRHLLRRGPGGDVGRADRVAASAVDVRRRGRRWRYRGLAGPDCSLRRDLRDRVAQVKANLREASLPGVFRHPNGRVLLARRRRIRA
jgi:hypothetical protein